MKRKTCSKILLQDIKDFHTRCDAALRSMLPSPKTAKRGRARLYNAMKRPGLLPQICNAVALGVLAATGLLVVAAPILFVRLVVAIAVDGIRWK